VVLLVCVQEQQSQPQPAYVGFLLKILKNMPKQPKELTGTPKKIVIFLIVTILTILFVVLGSYAAAWLNSQNLIVFILGYVGLGVIAGLNLALIVKAFQEK
jgi:hypothetical protein